MKLVKYVILAILVLLGLKAILDNQKEKK